MKKPWSKRHARRISYTKNHKNKLIRYYDNLTEYPTPVYIQKKDGNLYYKRIYKSQRAKSRAAWYLKCCNRKVRHYKGEIPSGSQYKRLADYWWLLY